MSKSSVKKNGQEETAPSAETGAGSFNVEERESAIEELDEALDALPDGGGDADSDDEADSNPLAQVAVSGETSFESAEFEAEDETAADEGESDGGELQHPVVEQVGLHNGALVDGRASPVATRRRMASSSTTPTPKTAPKSLSA